MGNLLLHTAAGAGAGLEDLLARMRAEELLKQRGEMDQAQMRNIDSEISTRESTTQRANTTADIANRSAQTRLDALDKIMSVVGGGVNGTMPGKPADLSLPGQPPTPPREISGLQSLNTPEGRTSFQMAGLNPNESFGSVPTPPKPKGPEDFNAEEMFYTGLAKKMNYPDYKTWATDHPDLMAQARHKWAEQAFTPMQSSPPVVLTADPNNPNQTVYSGRADAVGKRGPLPSAQSDRVAAYNSTLDLIDQIETIGNKTNWQGIGPFAGPAGSFGKKFFGVGSDDAETLRNKINQLKAQASFQEGGKQFTGTEKDLLEAFLAGVNQDPSAAKTRLRSFRESAIRSLESLGASRTKNVTTDTGSGSDWYEEYLKRGARKPGGGDDL